MPEIDPKTVDSLPDHVYRRIDNALYNEDGNTGINPEAMWEYFSPGEWADGSTSNWFFTLDPLDGYTDRNPDRSHTLLFAGRFAELEHDTYENPDFGMTVQLGAAPERERELAILVKNGDIRDDWETVPEQQILKAFNSELNDTDQLPEAHATAMLYENEAGRHNLLNLVFTDDRYQDYLDSLRDPITLHAGEVSSEADFQPVFGQNSGYWVDGIVVEDVEENGLPGVLLRSARHSSLLDLYNF